MDFKIIEKEAFTIVGLEDKEQTMANAGARCKKLWSEFCKQVDWKGKVMYGYSVGKDEPWTYVAGMEMDSVPEGMVRVNIPKSKYAVYTHQGPISKIGETYAYIYCKDIPQGKIKPKDFALEVYDERFKEESPDSVVDICIALEE